MPDGIDVSSYNRAPLPTALDTVQKLGNLQQQKQQIESGALTIDKQKLDLINQHYGYLIRELNSLPPEADAKQLSDVAINASKMGLLKPEMVAQFIRQIPTDPKQIPAFKEKTMGTLLDTQAAINWQHGIPGMITNQQTDTPVVTSSRFGIRATGAPIQRQIPPTTPTYDQNQIPTLQGPTPAQAAPGTVTGPLPAVRPNVAMPPPVGTANAMYEAQPQPATTAVPVPRPKPALPVQAPMELTPNARVAQGYPAPTGPRVGFAPGVQQAEDTAGAAGGAQLAEARKASATYQRDIYPLAQAISAVERLGTKGTGPGTETINHIKSFILSNVPGVKESDLSEVKDFDKAKKYFTDFVNQNSNTGTNDKLAAAFAGNPSVNISNAAAVDVAKAAFALRNMQQAQYLEWENMGRPAAEYPRWLAQQNNKVDPRAFGIEYMDQNAKAKLLKQLDRNPKEKALFEQSLQLGLKHGLIKPISGSE